MLYKIELIKYETKEAQAKSPWGFIKDTMRNSVILPMVY
jgi:hypothetical protein